MTDANLQSAVARTQAYYDGPADEIYRAIWGDNVHLGVPRSAVSSHLENMEHTNELMAQRLRLGPATRVLDLGCGYGSTARFLAARFGCFVTGTNISEKELALARQRAAETGLETLLAFEHGDFHHLKYNANSFGVVWSQEAFLHGFDKAAILRECHRVLVPGGSLLFTDILARRNISDADRRRICQRVQSPAMWDTQDYRDALIRTGFEINEVADWSEYVAPSYSWVRQQLKSHRAALLERVDAAILDATVDALAFWVDAANSGKIGWELFLAVKPAS